MTLKPGAPRAGARPHSANTRYSWRVRLTRGVHHAVYWRTFPKKMTVDDAAAWASSHHAVLKRVWGSGERAGQHARGSAIGGITVAA